LAEGGTTVKNWAWAATAALGLALMAQSYRLLIRQDPYAPWASGFLCVGKGGPTRPLQVGTRISTRLRYLPASESVQGMLKGLGAANARMKAVLEARLRPRLIELPLDAMAALLLALREGRLPQPGKDEVIAGGQARAQDHLSVAGRTLKVVGVLQPSVALFADSYLLSKHESAAALFPEGESDVQAVEVVDLKDADFRNSKILARVTDSFPSESFIVLAPEIYSSSWGFALYLAGQALFLLGGTGLLIGLYRYLSSRVSWPVLAEPLGELAHRPRLIWGVHVAYFGLYVLCALAVYQLPALNTLLMAAVQGELRSEGNGVLAVAGRAYGSGSIPYAAIVTFTVNFFLGSIAMITLPSMIIPGSGALVAALRATFWGLLLGPSQATIASAMMAHSGTLLVEGEGYILATFFALLIPIYMFGSNAPSPKRSLAHISEFDEVNSEEKRSSVWKRFKCAVALNLRANVLVAIVLAVAACYEAFEVITMARL
jgi:hypothetical protein